MKKIGAVVLIALLMVGFIFRVPVVKSAENIIYYSECEHPKTYRIESIDPKYNMSESQFQTHIQNASSIWSNAWGKSLFLYDPDGDIEINLVYDQRSFLSNQINELDAKVKEQQKSLDPEIAAYKERASQFRAKVAQLNSDIEYWNNRGGAPEDEYNKLKSRQTELRQEADVLQEMAARLNQSTKEYNEQVGQLHQTVNTFNQELTFKPEEGEYIINNGTQVINIYFDNSQIELIHTLAHELGHALSIDHNNNTLSIMYPKTTEATILSPDDLAALNKACEKKNIVKTSVNNLSIIFNQMQQVLSSRLVNLRSN